MEEHFAGLLTLIEDISHLIQEQKYIEIMNNVATIYNLKTNYDFGFTSYNLRSNNDLVALRHSRDNYKSKYNRERRRVIALRRLFNSTRDELEEEIATLAESNRLLQARYDRTEIAVHTINGGCSHLP